MKALRQILNCATGEILVEEYDIPDLTPDELAQQQADEVNEIIATLEQAVQTQLDNVAKQHRFDGIMSACTYVTSTVPQFAADAQACVVYRDQSWATCYEVMGKVQQGLRTIPTVEELLNELPAAPW